MANRSHAAGGTRRIAVSRELAAIPAGDEFLDRDLSWLEFNRRVLHEAMDERTPLLERVRFLGIFSSNLDEFFMKRVAVRRRKTLQDGGAVNDGRGEAARIMESIRGTVIELQRMQAECFACSIRPALARHGVYLLRWEELSAEEQAEAGRFFRASVYPILTPLAVDPGHPFPFISNLSESLGVVLRHPEKEGENLFARIKVPEPLPRWIRLRSAGGDVYRFVSLYDLIRCHLGDLFPQMHIADTMLFRVTRSADLELAGEAGEDLREMVTEELRLRRFAPVIRLEIGPNPSAWIRDFLMRELELESIDVYELTGELDYQDLRPIADLPLPEHRYRPWTPVIPPPLADEGADIFSIIGAGDLLVHHPYESFSASVERFITSAADDPRVLAIKLTLYRTSDESPFIRTLIRAAESGKQVVCVVELKARFDEQRNIMLAHELEKAGVHVVYGVLGLKTHSKTALVVRQEQDGVRCYAHIGTGNYHPHTARLYTDLGLFTCDPDITADLVELFNYLTGRSLKSDYRKLLVAPVNMRQRFVEMIAREAEHARAGRPAGIIAKMNSLEDRKLIRALHDASAAGVKCDLLVRGFCCLMPGIEGVSENIRVTSVIGRFLEHSRVYYFRNGAENPEDGEFYIGSADWMYRNLLWRVEVVVPVQSRPLRQRLWEILHIMLSDTRQAWEMQPDGSYVRRQPVDGTEHKGTHQTLMDLAAQRGREAAGCCEEGAS